MLGALPGHRGIDRHPARWIAHLTRHASLVVVAGSHRREWFRSRHGRLSL
jgi:hypothetical protein